MGTARHIIGLVMGLALVGSTAQIGAQGQYGYGYRMGDPHRLAGTYELDRARSDNPAQVIDRAVRALPPDERSRAADSLRMRLEAPQTLSIELRGRSVTIMSSNGPRMTFDADGRDRQEYGPGGRPITTHADLYGDELTVTTSGNRGSDFTVRFEPVQGGLRVTRQVTSDYNDLSAVEYSQYRRVSTEPNWNIYNGGYGSDRPSPGPGPRPSVLVPDGVSMIARTNRDIVASSSHEGDRFTMTVVDGPYRGAVVNGIVTKTYSGGGHASIDFDFDGIRLGDGRSGPFEADVDWARTPDGREIRANHEGGVRGDPTNADRPRDTAVGVGLGAIIGAIVGGGKGAAIGAVVGGAGSLVIQGQNDLRLPAGTEFRITAIGPR